MFQLLDPWFLVLLPICGLGLWWSFRYVRGMIKSRKRLTFVVRAILVTCLVLALCAPQARLKNEGTCTIFVIDRSDSMTESEKNQSEAFVRRAIQGLNGKDQIGVVSFGKRPAIEAMPESHPPFVRMNSEIDGSASDISSATRLASGIFSPGMAKRLVVISDFNETDGDVIQAVRAARAQQITVDTLTFPRDTSQAEVAVIALEAPDQVRPDQPFQLRAVLDSNVENDVELTTDRNGVSIGKTLAHLTPGRNAILVQDQLKEAGLVRYRVTIKPQRDHDTRNNVGMTFVSVKDRASILVLQEDTTHRELVDALEKGGIKTDLRSISTMPVRVDQILGYDAIILNDFNARFISGEMDKAIANACRDSGIGLAMIGGDDSFLPGGWFGSKVSEVLPVDLEVRNRKSFPSTSICIMIDASGSMGMEEDGYPKLRIAAKAASDTVRLMSERDRLAVAGSSDGIEFVLPMQQLNNKSAAVANIERMAVNAGGIYIRPSMNKAREVLEAEHTQVRHLILMADGDDSEDQGSAIDTALAMNLEHITTTVVAIGDGKDVEFLKKLAAAGGGQYFLADHASKLPAIVTQDTAIVSRSAIVDEPFFPKLVGSDDATKGLTEIPQLLAYDLVDTKPTSKLSMVTEKDDPLLATWQIGLGNSLAFTSDAKAKWATNWVSWNGFSAFWSQAMRGILRRAGTGKYATSVKTSGGKAIVDVKAIHLDEDASLPAPSHIVMSGPDGTSTQLQVNQVGPGEYKATFDASTMGTYVVSTGEEDSVGNRVDSVGLSVAYPPEYQSFAPNVNLAKTLAMEGGGGVLTPLHPEAALKPLAIPGESIKELWPLFVALGLLLLPFDVAVRRLVVAPWKLIPKRRASQPGEQQQVSDRLLSAKSRAPKRPQSPAATINSAPDDPNKPSQPAPAQDSATTAASLLEAKRKRKQ